MRSLGFVSFTFLSWSLVEVNSQTFPYVSFMNQTLVNHSYVDLSLVGRPDSKGSNTSVKCHTDLTTCCSASDGIHRGDWYFPNGTRLPFAKSFGIFEVRVCQRVDLHCNSRASSGIYCCDIPTNVVHGGKHTSVRDRPVYVGLYASGRGICLSASIN